MFTAPTAAARFPYPYRDEPQVLTAALLRSLQRQSGLGPCGRAGGGTPWVHAVRDAPGPVLGDGKRCCANTPSAAPRAWRLMRLAEALLRVPDAETAIALTADQLGKRRFRKRRRWRSRWPPPHAGQPVGQRDHTCPRSCLPEGGAPVRGCCKRLGAQDRGCRHRARHPAAGPSVRAGPFDRRCHRPKPNGQRKCAAQACVSATTCSGEGARTDA